MTGTSLLSVPSCVGSGIAAAGCGFPVHFSGDAHSRHSGGSHPGQAGAGNNSDVRVIG